MYSTECALCKYRCQSTWVYEDILKECSTKLKVHAYRCCHHNLWGSPESGGLYIEGESSHHKRHADVCVLRQVRHHAVHLQVTVFLTSVFIAHGSSFSCSKNNLDDRPSRQGRLPSGGMELGGSSTPHIYTYRDAEILATCSTDHAFSMNSPSPALRARAWE